MICISQLIYFFLKEREISLSGLCHVSSIAELDFVKEVSISCLLTRNTGVRKMEGAKTLRDLRLFARALSDTFHVGGSSETIGSG